MDKKRVILNKGATMQHILRWQKLLLVLLCHVSKFVSQHKKQIVICSGNTMILSFLTFYTFKRKIAFDNIFALLYIYFI